MRTRDPILVLGMSALVAGLGGCAGSLDELEDDLDEAALGEGLPGCGAPEPDAARLAAFERDLRGRAALKAASDGAPIVVPIVFVHLVAPNGSGRLDGAQDQLQLDALRAAFAGTGFVPTLAQSLTVELSEEDKGEFARMAPDALHRLLKRDHGIVPDATVVRMVTGDLVKKRRALGDSSLPQSLPIGTPGDLVRLDWRVFADEGLRHVDERVGTRRIPFQAFGEGDTAVHELGHWLGLLHTFQGGCDSPVGDYVSDTPAMMWPSTSSCDALPPTDSCPRQPLPDPDHNFMNYKTDACLSELTAGQGARMQLIYDLWRRPPTEVN